jgi:hypothetical protein
VRSVTDRSIYRQAVDTKNRLRERAQADENYHTLTALTGRAETAH